MTAALRIGAVLLFCVGIYFCTRTAANRASGGELVPTQHLAAFADADCTTPLPLTLQGGKTFPILERREQNLNARALIPGTPIVRRTTMYLVPLGGQKVWCSENIVVEVVAESAGQQRLRRTIRYDREPMLLGSACILGAVVVWMLSMARLARWRFWIGFPVLRLVLVLLYFGLNGVFFSLDGDAFMYLTIAKEWAALDRQSAVPGSVGAGLVYMLLLPVLPGDTMDAIGAISVFNVVVVGTVQLLILMFIARRLLDGRGSHIAAAAMAVLPVVVQVVRFGVPGPDFVGKSMIALTTDSPYAITHYRWANQNLWNAMSEPPMLTAILLALLCALTCRDFKKRNLFTGLLLGFAVSCRYSAVAVVPAFVALEALRDPAVTRQWRLALLGAGCFAVGAVAGGCPQLIDNWMVNGNPLQPSVAPTLYNPDAPKQMGGLFDFARAPAAWQLYGQVHFKALWLLILSLLCVRSAKWGLVLWLWVAGTLLFVTGLRFHAHNTVRYLLPCIPPLVLAMGFAGDAMKHSKRMVAAITIILANAAFLTPEDSSGVGQLLAPAVEWCIAAASLAAVAALLWRDRRSMFFACGALAVLTTGQWQWVVALYILLLPWLCWRVMTSWREGTLDPVPTPDLRN